MAAPVRVSAADIVSAMRDWHGDVANAARAVGLSRNGLYQRLARLGLDPDTFRQQDNLVPTVSTMPTMSTKAGRAQQSPRAHKSDGAIFRSVDGGRTLGSMNAPAVAGVEEVPIKTAPRRHLPLRFKPDVRDRLQRAVWRLQSKFQVPTDESLILEQLIEEELEGWVLRKLGEAEPPIGGNGKKKGGRE